jgi:hypothetical protein
VVKPGADVLIMGVVRRRFGGDVRLCLCKSFSLHDFSTTLLKQSRFLYLTMVVCHGTGRMSTNFDA